MTFDTATPGKSHEPLLHVYGQFSERFDAADLQAAKRLLAGNREWGSG